MNQASFPWAVTRSVTCATYRTAMASISDWARNLPSTVDRTALDPYYGDDPGYAFEFFLRIRPSQHSHAANRSTRSTSPERKNDGRARPSRPERSRRGAHSLGTLPAIMGIGADGTHQIP